ncbi:hypothetical protein EZS27_003892 [termite gut metagenome]|uniref:Uncharacterized protein n=1 Tax=termite gut metagenome TaxID=433724 RepID=A0A5J4SQY9_9ZZZZ
MLFICKISIDGVIYNATDDFKNWEDIKSEYRRRNFDGVSFSHTGDYEFVGKAREILKEEYRKNYLSAQANILFYVRNNRWVYEQVYDERVDFSTYKDDGYILSVHSKENDLENIVTAKKSVKYEYPVSELKEAGQLEYDGLRMENTQNWVIAGESVKDSGDVIVTPNPQETLNYTLPIYKTTDEILNQNKILLSDEKINITDEKDKDYIIEAINDCDIELNIDLLFRIESDAILSGSLAAMRLYINENGTDIPPSTAGVFTHVKALIPLNLKRGDIVKLKVAIQKGFDPWYYPIRFSEVSIFAKWIDRLPTPEKIDVINPVNLLNRLISSMADGSEAYHGEIEYEPAGSKLQDCVLLAAESIRGIEPDAEKGKAGAKIYSSFSDFASWMEAVFGYAYELTGNSVIFRHRTRYFNAALDIEKTIENYNEFKYSIVSSLIWSSVKIGYNKQDYSNVNGRDEFRFTNTFSNKSVAPEAARDTALSLISPYRADAYGIEFLVQERGEKTKDDYSDNDLFFVGASYNPSDGLYYLVRNLTASGLIAGDTMFNLMYSPRFMILANREYIGISANLLEFASGEGNTDVLIDGISEKESVSISRNEALASVGEIEVETADDILPVNKLAPVQIYVGNNRYICFIKDILFGTAKESEVAYTLIVKEML